MSRRILFLAMVALLLIGHPTLAQKKPCPALETHISDSQFKPGQVWTYSNRPGESASTFTILQIDRGENAMAAPPNRASLV